jgi:hypothetical protein
MGKINFPGEYFTAYKPNFLRILSVINLSLSVKKGVENIATLYVLPVLYYGLPNGFTSSKP